MPRPRRITIEVGDSLHRRIKVACATEGRRMNVALVELLDRTFADKPVKPKPAVKSSRQLERTV